VQAQKPAQLAHKEVYPNSPAAWILITMLLSLVYIFFAKVTHNA